jgi:cobalt-zinc-cadmium efflux system outer membrane protein
MTRSIFVAWALAVPSIVQAQANPPFTLDQVLALAARQNPEVLIARAREVEARGRLATASVRFASNPDLDLFLGSRQQSAGGSTPEVDFNVLQRVEIAGQRGLRIESATAQISQRSADVDMAALTARAATSAAFYRALYADRLREVARQAEQLADDLGKAAQARYEAGETAVLDVNLARVERARARRDRLSAEGLLERAYGELREILALPAEAPLGVEGDWPGAAPPSLDALLLRVADRPDVRSLTAGVTEADAEWRLTRAMRRPDLIAGVGLRREDGEPIAGGHVGFTLPLFQRNVGVLASALARIDAARLSLDARRRALETRIRSTHKQYITALEALTALTAGGLPLVEENEQLAGESYQAGKLNLVDLLVIRRDGFAARRETLDAQLSVALAATELRLAAGTF